MAKRIILQVDGGGILGITPAMVLAELEAQLRVRCNNNALLLRDKLELSCGTSTGSIITGLVAAGVSAADIAKFYAVDGVHLFENSKNPLLTRVFLKPKFKREDFLRVLDKILATSSAYNNADVTLGQLPKRSTLMVTAYNLCSHRTHFVKSTDQDDSNTKLRDAIAWSALSAAHYFGKIPQPDYPWTLLDNQTPPNVKKMTGALFQDGGQGTQNCTLDYVLTEILANQWETSEQVIIASLGTGSKTKVSRYESAVETSVFGETFKYIANQARDESTTIQELGTRYVASARNNFKFFRLDYEAAEDYALDDTKNIEVYKAGAKAIINSVDFKELVNALAD